MLAIIGLVVVFGAIISGYLMEHGNLRVLLQPAELVIIFGAAVGTLLVANPLPTVIRILKGISGVFGGNPYSQAYYLENLKMLNEIFGYGRKMGMAKLEEDVDAPEKCPVFAKYPRFLKNHHALYFFCDTIRTSTSGGVDPMDLDILMETDMEVHHEDAHEPVAALNTMADALPGLGIVAAVLGVVITMGSLGGPPEEIGHKVAAALVGTFLGILLCYGLFGPLASGMSKIGVAEGRYFNFLRVGILAFVKGGAPIMAVEFARRAIPSGVRPTFKEMEAACRGGGAAAAAKAA